jgi:hypothetical protein
MKLSDILSFTGKIGLFLLEYTFKVLAGVTSLIVLGAQGSFFTKLGTGFGSLLNVVSEILETPGRLVYIGNVIHDYDTLTASAFNQRYGGQAINRVMESLNEGVVYFQSVYQNLAHQPIATLLATSIAFLTFYFIGRTFRFIRQKGQGSFLVRLERKLGKRFFRKSEESGYFPPYR